MQLPTEELGNPKSDENGRIPGTAPAVALTIAGLDPSCGAGITADLKTFAAHRLYGICCATALTVQSTLGVEQVVPLDPSLVNATLDCLAADIPPAGIKIGMLATGGIAGAVADFLAKNACKVIVLDPILRSTSGATLLDEEGMSILRERLLPLIGWITPNLEELALLLDEPVGSAADVPRQAARLQQMAARDGNSELRVVVTGGELERPNDYFLDAARSGSTGGWVKGERVRTAATHGTGCAFSSALLCQLVHGVGAKEAVIHAKVYVTEALRLAYPIGGGKGPMHHLFQY